MGKRLEAALEWLWLALLLAATYPVLGSGKLLDQWLGLAPKPAVQEPLPRPTRSPIVVVTNDVRAD